MPIHFVFTVICKWSVNVIKNGEGGLVNSHARFDFACQYRRDGLTTRPILGIANTKSIIATRQLISQCFNYLLIDPCRYSSLSRSMYANLQMNAGTGVVHLALQMLQSICRIKWTAAQDSEKAYHLPRAVTFARQKRRDASRRGGSVARCVPFVTSRIPNLL